MTLEFCDDSVGPEYGLLMAPAPSFLSPFSPDAIILAPVAPENQYYLLMYRYILS
jgi:hypothetical protein